MHTTHWTWESQPFDVPWRDEPVTIGKKNQINNFCIGTQGNQNKCMTCHTGYGWSDANFDFTNPENVDCLACHADTATYAKGAYGFPAEGIDLLAAAKSVSAPTRENCGKCHFDGGGGNGVKHGDLDESLYFPQENLDVHMVGWISSASTAIPPKTMPSKANCWLTITR
jgi:nitrate reductase cytochrome c-type subunit